MADAFEFREDHALFSTRSRALAVRPDPLKPSRTRADPGNVLWFIGIASVWSFVCLVAVSLCVVAGRADRALLESAPADVAVAALPDDVGFVVAFAEPTPEAAHEARPAARTPVH